jgi:hypothetical protein
MTISPYFAILLVLMASNSGTPAQAQGALSSLYLTSPMRAEISSFQSQHSQFPNPVARFSFLNEDGATVDEGDITLQLGQRVFGSANIAGLQQSFTHVCFSIETKYWNSEFRFLRPCQSISAENFRPENATLSLHLSRSLVPTTEYLAQNREKIRELILTGGSDPPSILHIERLFQDYVEAETVSFYDIRLLADIISIANQNGVKLASHDYFSLGTTPDPTNNSLRTILLKGIDDDISVNSRNLATRELFDQLQKIDLDIYASGSPSFGREYFRTVSFLAENIRDVYLSEPTRDATGPIEDFARLCKESSVRFRQPCVKEFVSIADSSYTKVTNLSDTSLARNSLRSLQYITEADGCSDNFELPQTYSLLKEYYPRFCDLVTNCVSKFADLSRCFEEAI